MMSNIPLKCLLGAIAVVSITGCNATADREFVRPEEVCSENLCWDICPKGYTLEKPFCYPE